MNLLFYSEDGYFLQEFSDYISRTQKDIQMITYDDLETAKDYLRQNSRRIDMILADEYFFADLPVMDKLKVICSNKTRLTVVNDCFSVNIYQPGDDIVRNLRKLAVDRPGESFDVELSQDECKTVAFFSVQGGGGQSTIAYQLAAHLAQQQKVLFVSFDFVNVYQKFYQEDYPVDLAQLMFQIKDRRNAPAEFYKAIVRNQHGVYVLPPFQTIGDIVELTLADLEFLLEQLKQLGEFNYLVLDLNHNVDELNQFLLRQSDKIVAVYSADKFGQVKMEQFKRDPFIEHWQIDDKIQFVSSKAQSVTVESWPTFPLVVWEGMADPFACFFENPGFKAGCQELIRSL